MVLYYVTHIVAPVIGLQPGSDRNGAVSEVGKKRSNQLNIL